MPWSLVACSLLAACPAAPAPEVTASPYTPSAPPSAPNDVDRVPMGTFTFFEDFERGADAWTLTPDAHPAWRLLKAKSCGGEFTLFFGLADKGLFTGPATESVVTLNAPLDLGAARHPVLKFDTKGIATPAAALALQAEIRPRGGDWRPIGRRVLASHLFVTSVVSDLGPWVGQAVGLRFRAALGAVDEPIAGIFLDDVAVIESYNP